MLYRPGSNVPSISVVLSTYNSAAYLEKVLAGLGCQDRLPDEVIVADDGSDDETPAIVAKAAARGKFRIEHVWQEHDGFRKCQILNRAIDAAIGDYLIFVDGDCIPRGDFVAAHSHRATPGRFLSGGVFRLPRAVSDSIALADIENGSVFDLDWLRRNGVRVPALSKVGAAARFGKLLSGLTPTRATFNGHNSSAWRADVLRVNGFDERMVYGGLDRELGERLENAGIRGLGIRYEAVCLHLDHDRFYVDAEGLKANGALRDDTRRRKATWTAYGLVRDTAGMAMDGTSAAAPDTVDDRR